MKWTWASGVVVALALPVVCPRLEAETISATKEDANTSWPSTRSIAQATLSEVEGWSAGAPPNITLAGETLTAGGDFNASAADGPPAGGLAKDEGHGFRKKADRDCFGAATVLLLEHFLF